MQTLKKIKLYDDYMMMNYSVKLNNFTEQIINLFQIINYNELLKELCNKYRIILQKISKESKIDIKPEILTPLLDKLIQNKNIIYSICPGKEDMKVL